MFDVDRQPVTAIREFIQPAVANVTKQRVLSKRECLKIVKEGNNDVVGSRNILTLKSCMDSSFSAFNFKPLIAVLSFGKCY